MNIPLRMRNARWFRICFLGGVFALFIVVWIGWICLLNYYHSLTPPHFSVWTTEERDDFGFSSIDPLSFRLTEMFSLKGGSLVYCSFVLSHKRIDPQNQTVCAMAVVDLDRAKRIFYAEWTNTIVAKSNSTSMQEWDFLFNQNAFAVDGHPFIHIRRKYERLSPILPPAISAWIPYIHPIYSRHFLFDTQGNAQILSDESIWPAPRGYPTFASLSLPPTREATTHPQSSQFTEYQALGLTLKKLVTLDILNCTYPSYPLQIAEHCYLIHNDLNRDFYLVQTQPPLARSFHFSDIIYNTTTIGPALQSMPYHRLTLPTDPYPLFHARSLGNPVFRIHPERLEREEIRDCFELVGENYSLKPYAAMRNNQVLLFDNAERYYRREEPNLELWMSEREDRFSQTGWFPAPRKMTTLPTNAQLYGVLDSERLLMAIDSAIWTIRWDGTDLKQVFPKVKEKP